MRVVRALVVVCCLALIGAIGLASPADAAERICTVYTYNNQTIAGNSTGGGWSGTIWGPVTGYTFIADNSGGTAALIVSFAQFPGSTGNGYLRNTLGSSTNAKGWFGVSVEC